MRCTTFSLCVTPFVVIPLFALGSGKCGAAGAVGAAGKLVFPGCRTLGFPGGRTDGAFPFLPVVRAKDILLAFVVECI